MQVTATGVYTTKGGQKAVVESLYPATGYIVRDDSTTTKHIWQTNGKHGLSARSSQLELICTGFTPPAPVVLEPEFAGYCAKIRNRDGSTFWTSPRRSYEALEDLLFAQNWSDSVVEYGESTITVRVVPTRTAKAA